jgi:hypothetical protein
MEQVVIGVDPHKLSATIEVVDPVGATPRIWSLHYRSGRLRRDACLRQGLAGSYLGRRGS